VKQNRPFNDLKSDLKEALRRDRATKIGGTGRSRITPGSRVAGYTLRSLSADPN